MLASVFLAKADYSVISMVVFLVVSRVWISSLFSKMVEESALASDSRSWDSSLSRVTAKSFCFFTNSCFYISSSFFSMFTTVARSCSSRPDSVTMKLMIVH